MAKDKKKKNAKKDAVERFMDKWKLAKAKSENLKVLPSRPYPGRSPVKELMRTGKCSPGKVLKGNKCVPRPRRKIEP